MLRLQLAFSLVLLLRLETGVALGFFAMGCAPGGGASNIYTYLLNGDLSLSITMTTISTFASLGNQGVCVCVCVCVCVRVCVCGVCVQEGRNS